MDTIFALLTWLITDHFAIILFIAVLIAALAGFIISGKLITPTPFRSFALEAEALRRQQALANEMRDILTIAEEAIQHCSTRIKEVDRSISLQERKERVARRRPLQRRLGRV